MTGWPFSAGDRVPTLLPSERAVPRWEADRFHADDARWRDRGRGAVHRGQWHDRAGKEQLVRREHGVLGRKTYEGLAAYWSPLNGDWADLVDPKPKYVASRALHGPLESSSTLLIGDAAGAVTRLKDKLPWPLRVPLWRAGPVPARGSTDQRLASGFILGLGSGERAPCRARPRSLRSSVQRLSTRRNASPIRPI